MELPSAKWVVSTLVTVSGALVVFVVELQAGGVELPSIVVAVTVALAAVASYLKRETRPPSSAVEAVHKRL